MADQFQLENDGTVFMGRNRSRSAPSINNSGNYFNVKFIGTMNHTGTVFPFSLTGITSTF